MFIIESLRQAVSQGFGVTFHIVAVRSARFLTPLLSGDVLILDATVEQATDGTLSVLTGASREHDDAHAAKLHLLPRQHEVTDA